MKKLLLILFLPILLNAQNNDIYKPNSEIVNAEGSIIFPLGNLSNKFDYAQSYGFWFKLGEDRGLAANVGFNLFFLKDARPINYKFKDSIYAVNSNKFGLDFGIRASKIILVSKNQERYLELSFTLGIDYLAYDLPKDETKKEEDQGQPDIFKNPTILLSPEMRYMFKNVGVKLQYRYTPYGIIREYEPKFGSSSISFGIVYKQ